MELLTFLMDRINPPEAPAAATLILGTVVDPCDVWDVVSRPLSQVFRRRGCSTSSGLTATGRTAATTKMIKKLHAFKTETSASRPPSSIGTPSGSSGSTWEAACAQERTLKVCWTRPFSRGYERTPTGESGWPSRQIRRASCPA